MHIGIGLPSRHGIGVGIDLPASIEIQLRNLEWIRCCALDWFGSLGELVKTNVGCLDHTVSFGIP